MHDNLLVFYLPDADEWWRAVARRKELGHQGVKAFNPYWDKKGKTFEDPDGYCEPVRITSAPPRRNRSMHMLPAPDRPEIDHRTLKLIVGVIALSLAGLTWLYAKTPITSISASYYEGGWSQSIFIGFLFAIAAFMLAYNGMSEREMILSKVASAAGLGVALFPCQCDGHTEVVPYVHGASASVMFFILTYFCYGFFHRAISKASKAHMQAGARAGIYALCGIAILVAILTLTVDHFSGHALSARMPRLTFWGETTALVAFGISWLVASRVMPVLTREDERFSPLREHNPA